MTVAEHRVLVVVLFNYFGSAAIPGQLGYLEVTDSAEVPLVHFWEHGKWREARIPRHYMVPSKARDLGWRS